MNDPEINLSYFRATDCASVSGPFLKFRANPERICDEDYQKVFAIRDRFLESIRKGDLIGCAISVLVEDYNEVMATHQMAKKYFDQDPLFAAYQMIMVETARKVSEQIPDAVVAYVYDENDKKSKAEAVYADLKEKNPSYAKYMGSLTHMDDRRTPALQAADLMASELSCRQRQLCVLLKHT